MNRWTVEEDTKLRDFLSRNLQISKNKAKEIIDTKTVFVNHKRVWIATYQLRRNNIVEYNSAVIRDKDGDGARYTVIYEDEYIIGVNKPPFLISDNDKGSLEEILRLDKNNPCIKAVHRLDKDTSGVILYAKDRQVFEKYKVLWKAKTVDKVYLALCQNEANFHKIRIDKDVDGKSAVSYVEPISSKNGFSYIKIHIETGRKHQIRLHLASIRLPIIGDKEIGMKTIENPVLKNVTRQMLHAFIISLQCPFTGKRVHIEAPLPGDFSKLGGLLGLL